MNILLITADTLRADHLGCYGYHRQTSPNIDALASKSIQFMNVSSVINNTNPSHISMFTAEYPKDHGVYTLVTPLGKGHVTLAEILKDRKYQTAAFVSANHLSNAMSGLGRGFDVYREAHKMKVPADETIENALDWIRENPSKKFFVWIHLFDPHMPYDPPFPYNKAFDRDYTGWGKIFFDVYTMKAPADQYIKTPGLTNLQAETLKRISDGRFSSQDIIRNKVGFSDRDVEYVKSLYDGEIKFMDYYIGFLLNEMQKLGLDRNTLIIFTADHGESLGEHGIYFDHIGIYEPSIKVPLIIYIPQSPAKKNNSMVSNMDILPTLLYILNISVSSKIRQHFDGISLMPLLQDGTVNVIHKELFIEHANNLAKLVKNKDYKYIRPADGATDSTDSFVHKDEFYDLGNDPGELNNLRETKSLENTPYEEMKKSLLDWAGDTWMITKDEKAFEQLKREQREKLKALGYINN